MTAGLLGVDFVPDFRRVDAESLTLVEPKPAPRAPSDDPQQRLDELRERYEVRGHHPLRQALPEMLA